MSSSSRFSFEEWISMSKETSIAQKHLKKKKLSDNTEFVQINVQMLEIHVHELYQETRTNSTLACIGKPCPSENQNPLPADHV